jgi:hypothetical protein
VAGMNTKLICYKPYNFIITNSFSKLLLVTVFAV